MDNGRGKLIATKARDSVNQVLNEVDNLTVTWHYFGFLLTGTSCITKTDYVL